MSADALFSAGNVASFRMQVSRTTRKVGPGAPQRPCASLGFDERNRLGFGHRLAPVLAMRSRQRRAELEPDNLAANDGRRIHDTSVCEGQPLTQAIRPCIPPNLPQPPGNTRGVRLDPMVCALGIKAATTKQAIVALCELGDGANALALTRVLLENACLLEWLIRGEGRRRLESYVMFMSVQHERIAETIDRHRARFPAAGATGKSDLIRPTVRHGITRSATRKIDRRGAIRPTWEFGRMTRQGAPVSVRGLFGEITDADPSYTTSRDGVSAAVIIKGSMRSSLRRSWRRVCGRPRP